MELTRRGFIKLTGAGLAATSIGALGFGFAGAAQAAAVRAFKLTAASETRNTCTYCSVACGILIYSQGDRAKNVKQAVIHIEGDPDHPVNRGTLCPKGAGLLDIVHAPGRLTKPIYRPAGSREWKEVSWDFALDRIAKLMKEDRDTNFIAKNAAGTTVLLTTHYLEEAEALCDRIAIIDRGKLVAHDDTRTLLSKMDSKILTVTLDRGLVSVPEALAPFTPSLVDERRLVFQYKPSVTTVGEILAGLQTAHLGVVDISTEEADLEDIFLRLTNADATAE